MTNKSGLSTKVDMKPNDLEFIKSIILNNDEQKYYKSAIEYSTIFGQTDEKNLSNLSPIYRVTLLQNSKYQTTPSMKTYYTVKANYPQELKSVIQLLNSSSNDENRKQLLIMKSILMNRYYNTKEVKETTYDDFMVKAGGFVRCVKCSFTDVTIENKNNRSGDEPTATFYECQRCGEKFFEKIVIKLNK